MTRELILGSPDTIDYWPVTREKYQNIIPGKTMESEFTQIDPGDDAIVIAKSKENVGQLWVRMCKSFSAKNCQKCNLDPRECVIKANMG